jgi:NADP-dependent 3-hydroxy acid dehydrogenase YdfG
VTGAGGDIGRALCAALAEREVSVALVGRRRAKLERAARELSGAGHHALVANLAVDSEVRSVVGTFFRRYARLDILIHSNGSHVSGPLEGAHIRDFDRMWAANVRSPFLLTQLLVPALRESSGQIVFVNSSVGLGGRPGVGQFTATQHALRSLAETFRAELNSDGVRVLNVFPGRTATERQRRIFVDEGRRYRPERLLQPRDIADIVAQALALPRTAEVTDIQIRSARKP